MSDRLSAIDAATLHREPVALGHQIELLVVESDALRDRAGRRALRSTGAPLLIVPPGGEETWQPGWLGASAPLALVRSAAA